MPKVTEIRRSFSGGEISPLTDGRTDLDKYQTSLRYVTDFKPNIYGGLFSRPGTEFIGRAKYANNVCRLIDFEFGADNVLVLEIGHLYMRFWYAFGVPGRVAPASWGNWTTGTFYPQNAFLTQTGAVYRVNSDHTSGTFATDLGAGLLTAVTALDGALELITPWTSAMLDELQFAQDNNAIYIAHQSVRTHILRRHWNERFDLEYFLQEWPATLPKNTTGRTMTPTSLDTPGLITASGPVFSAGMEGSRWILEHRREDPSVSIDLATVVNGGASMPLYVLGDWSASIKADQVGAGDYESRIAIQRSTTGSGGTYQTIRTISSNRASIQQIIAGTTLEPSWLRIKVIEKTNPSNIPPGLTAEIEATDSSHYGIFEITGIMSSTVANMTPIVELHSTTATRYWSEGAHSDFRGHPRSVTLFQDRLYLGGTSTQPQTVWGSVIDDHGNFRTGSEDDLGLSFRASSNTGHAIQWMTSKDALIIGTTGSEWVYGGRNSSEAITPQGTTARLSTSYGSAHVQPVLTQDAVLFLSATKTKIREFAYSFDKDGFNAEDLNLMAEHITGAGITQMALARNPNPVIWSIKPSTSHLLGLTYERSQGISGWFRYATQGAFESVCCPTFSTSPESHIWVSVQRVINNDIGEPIAVRYIERFRPNQIDAIKGGETHRLVYSDCSKMFQLGSPAEVFSVQHLQGKEVSILADGSPHPNRTVGPSGDVELDYPASNVVIGLSYIPTMDTTWLETNDPQSKTKSFMKRPTRITMELWKTLGLEFSGNGGKNWTPVEFLNQSDFLDEAPPLFTGIKKEDVIADSADQASIMIRQTQPLPLNLISLLIDYDLADVP